MKNYFNAFCPHVHLGFQSSVTSEAGETDLRGPLLILTMEQYRRL
jgi:hypothetical protein